jgi:hypothetical protein
VANFSVFLCKNNKNQELDRCKKFLNNKKERKKERKKEKWQKLLDLP